MKRLLRKSPRESVRGRDGEMVYEKRLGKAGVCGGVGVCVNVR